MAATDTVRSTFDLASSVLGSGFVAGVELEIEDVRDFPTLPEGWHMEEDGSLRNHGHEFISPPASRQKLQKDFATIHETIDVGKNPFTERTSIHVHVNMLDLTQEQAKSVVLYYALFEPVFFAMVDPIRRNNIHCVGLDQTTLSENYKRTLPLFVNKWSKYTALNLLPLSTQGTIEFRHMQGHKNQEKFNEWLSTLENLWTYGKECRMCRGELTEEGILKAFDFIFKDAEIKSLRSVLMNVIADPLLDVKLALV